MHFYFADGENGMDWTSIDIEVNSFILYFKELTFRVLWVSKFLILNKNSWNCLMTGLRKFPSLLMTWSVIDIDSLFKAITLLSTYFLSRSRLKRKDIGIKRNSR